MYIGLYPRPDIVPLAAAGMLKTLPDASVDPGLTVEILAADSRRLAVAVQNLSAETARVGDSDTGPARGSVIRPGEAVTLNTNAALFAHNPGTGAIQLSILYLGI